MDELSLNEILSVCYRRRRVFFITAGAVFLLALVLVLRWSRYEAIATVEIDQPAVPSSVTAPASISAATGMTGSAMIADMVMGGVADRRISQAFQKVTTADSLMGVITELNLYPSLNQKLEPEKLAEIMRKKLQLSFISANSATPMMAQMLSKSADQASSLAFTLRFQYSDPALAKQAVDALLKRLITAEAHERHEQTRETSNFLAAELQSIESKLADEEKKVAEFRSQFGDSGTNMLIFNQQANMSTNITLQSVEGQISTSEATLGTLRGQLAATDPYLPIIEEGETLNTPTAQLKSLQAQYASLSGRYGNKHPDVLKLREQIAALKKEKGSKSSAVKRDADNPVFLQLTAQIAAMEAQKKSLISQRDSLKAQQQKLEQKIAADPMVEQKMSQLMLDLLNTKEQYSVIKAKKAAADMKEKLESSSNAERLKILNPATVPDSTTPKRKWLLVGGLMASLMAGAGMVLLMELLGQPIRSAAHLEKLIGTPPLVRIPVLPLPATPTTPPPEAATAFHEQVLEQHRILAHRTRSAPADKFRILRTQVLQAMAQGGMKTLGITSAHYGDGKSTLALNLALSIAQDVNQTVLLVDLDLRKPNVAEYLGLKATTGLTDYFTREVPLAECLVRTPFPRLSVLPAGRALDHSSEMLGSPKISALAEEMKSRYPDRLIIYDLPPVLAQDDPLVFLPQMDALLLVVKEGVTSTQELKTTLHALGTAHVLGTVLNHAHRAA